MTRLLTLTAVALMATTALAQENNKPPKGFTALFDGKAIKGWHGMKTEDPSKSENRKQRKPLDILEHWSVEDGELVNDGHGAYLTTIKDYGDMELLIDYKTVPKADSGIYLRGVPQVQIWDSTEKSKFRLGANLGSGGLWNNPKGWAGKDPLTLADKPFGEWNRFRIIQVGSRTWVWLNGKKVVDNALMDNYWRRGHPLLAKGPIQLQTHGGEIRWRNIFVREIGAEEGNKLLRGKDPEGFKSVFNGKNLEGWAGAVNNYEVRHGAILCKKGSGGNLFTKEQYADFVVRLEFKLPPAGNNGLAIRYPGKGNPAYAGMTELQVLSADYPGKLKDYQFHGSAYGMVPADKGYLRPVGQWNYQEVVVKGSTITVELNGNVILRADLSKVKTGNRHPGKDLTKGHFGFAGHNDPVQFRSISIKRLK